MATAVMTSAAVTIVTEEQTMEITNSDMHANAYETYYYTNQIGYTYEGEAVTFISETQFTAGGEIYEAANPFSAGRDFGNGTVTEGYFGTLPNIILKVSTLKSTKEEAVLELENYKSPVDYRDVQKTELERAIKEGKAVIDVSNDEVEVKTALAEAKVALDTIKTDAQMTEESAAAKLVDAKIMAIGTVTTASKEAIAEARAAYEALTAEAKAKVTKLDTLTAAEKAYKDLTTPVVTGWQKISGKWYYMYSNGTMAESTWIGRYYVNGFGAWTKTK